MWLSQQQQQRRAAQSHVTTCLIDQGAFNSSQWVTLIRRRFTWIRITFANRILLIHRKVLNSSEAPTLIRICFIDHNVFIERVYLWALSLEGWGGGREVRPKNKQTFNSPQQDSEVTLIKIHTTTQVQHYIFLPLPINPFVSAHWPCLPYLPGCLPIF